MLWAKSLHLMGMVAWFAAIFYLPRLFVYHAMSSDDISRERFKIMERKLYRGIMTPAMIFTLAMGAWLASYNLEYYWSLTWFKLKLILLAALVGYHFYCGHIRTLFLLDQNQRGHVFYRWFNEIPVFIMAGIILLAVFKPA